jgi:hypothetical protein
MKTYSIPQYGITVSITDGGTASIQSQLKEHLIGNDEKSQEMYYELTGAVDALESLILGHAAAGIDIGSQAYVAGLESSLAAIANNL